MEWYVLGRCDLLERGQAGSHHPSLTDIPSVRSGWLAEAASLSVNLRAERGGLSLPLSWVNEDASQGTSCSLKLWLGTVKYQPLYLLLAARQFFNSEGHLCHKSEREAMGAESIGKSSTTLGTLDMGAQPQHKVPRN